MLAATLLVTVGTAAAAAAAVAAPCTTATPQPCPNHPGHTFCESDPAPNQCERPAAAKKCPPCPPQRPPPPPPPGIAIPLPGNKDAKGAECQSWWCPMLIETNHSLMLFGCCKPAARTAPITGQMVRSTDSGKSWTKPILTASAGGQSVYSATSDTIVMLVGWPPANASIAVAGGSAVAAPSSREPQLDCTYYLEKYCKADAGKGATCLDCLKAPGHAVLHRGLCTATEVSGFCKSGSLPPAPPPVPRGVAWASQLPPLRATELAGCSAGVTKSTDDGHTWSAPKILMVNNSLGPHYGGNGLNHGIQIRNGPHKGRLALAERLDCPSAADEVPAYWRSYVLYSDTGGDTWTAGQLLPEGWCENRFFYVSLAPFHAKTDRFTKTGSGQI
jgi:hypothetical protein